MNFGLETNFVHASNTSTTTTTKENILHTHTQIYIYHLTLSTLLRHDHLLHH